MLVSLLGDLGPRADTIKKEVVEPPWSLAIHVSTAVQVAEGGRSSTVGK